MLTYQYLAKRRRVFKTLTGLSVAEFESIYNDFEPLWFAAEAQRLQRANRKRAIGGGGVYKLGLRTQVVMVMVWLRHYLTTETLGALFGVDKATISRNSWRLLKVLVEIDRIDWPQPPCKGQGNDLETFLAAYPDLLAVMDATEQAVQRPQDKAQEKAHYSAKCKQSTCKKAVVVNEVGVIRDLTATVPGRTHDLTLVRQSGLLARLPKEVTVVADAGFDGLAQSLPDHSVATAHKAQRNHPLTLDHKLANRLLSCERIIVENVFAHLKHFRCLTARFRHHVQRWHHIMFLFIAIIVNRRTLARLAGAA
jgi:DDE superfamily endonuclease